MLMHGVASQFVCRRPFTITISLHTKALRHIRQFLDVQTANAIACIAQLVHDLITATRCRNSLFFIVF